MDPRRAGRAEARQGEGRSDAFLCPHSRVDGFSPNSTRELRQGNGGDSATVLCTRAASAPALFRVITGRLGQAWPMKIRSVRCAGLRGATPEGGWSNELKPEDCVHTLVWVETDAGLTGVGSVFTSDLLVRGALQLLEPLLLGENALEPERVAEKLHQHTFWQGRGGSVTHTISGIDIALWDLLGQATKQPVGRLLGGRYRERVRPYASVLMEEPEALAERLQTIRAAGFRAFKIGWGPFGRRE